MSSRANKRVIGKYLSEAAYSLFAAGSNLNKDEIRRLREDGSKLVNKVRDSKKGKAFDGLTSDDMRLLLAYVVYFRQNLTTQESDRPNDEDAAKILHKEVFKDDEKKTLKRLKEELTRQLEKAGIKINRD